VKNGPPGWARRTSHPRAPNRYITKPALTLEGMP
jgi:hypothetical protein